MYLNKIKFWILNATRKFLVVKKNFMLGNSLCISLRAPKLYVFKLIQLNIVFEITIPLQ